MKRDLKYMKLYEDFGKININEVKDIFNSYGLDIFSIVKNDYIRKRYGETFLLPSELFLEEYRVTIGHIKTEEEVKDDNGDEWKDYKNEINTIIDVDEKLEFSIFLPKNTKVTNDIAFQKASEYLKMLNQTIPAVYEDSLDKYNSAVDEYIYDFKKFLNYNKIIITNDNIEILKDMSYRLYVDDKFVNYLSSYLGEDETQEFFKEWLNVI